MKKTILLSLLSLITIFSCAGGSNPPGPQPDPPGPGPQPDPPGPTPTYLEKPIKIVTTDGKDTTLEITHEYDESYRLIKSESKKYEKDKLTQDSIAQYTYNNHDDVTHFVLTIDNEEKMNYTDTYEYDKNGNMILDRSKGSWYDEVVNSKDIYQYDELNRVTLHEYYSAYTSDVEPELKEKYVYTYTKGKQYQEFEKKNTITTT